MRPYEHMSLSSINGQESKPYRETLNMLLDSKHKGRHSFHTIKSAYQPPMGCGTVRGGAQGRLRGSGPPLTYFDPLTTDKV